MHYAGIHDAIQHIKILGKDTFLCKTDIRSAFRILPVNPNDFELLGFQWGGNVTTTNVYPWAVAALELIAINKLGISGMVNKLDDI